MTFSFRPAVRERIGLLIGLAGASGSGKSLSALRLARGMCNGDDSKIAFIDTEAGRGLHYAPAKGQKPGKFVFAFKHGDMVAPFSPERYLEAILAAEKDGAEVIVIDSYSHLWNSEGGLQDIHDQIVAAQVEAARKAHTGSWKFDEVKTAERLSVGAWREPKGRNNRFVNRLLQCRAHLVFAMRADEKIRIEKVRENGRERTVIVQAKDMPPAERWVPICEKRFMFELTTSIILSPENPGVPIPVKMSAEHRPFFPEGKPISEEAGRLMAEWARGAVDVPEVKAASSPKPRDPPPPPPQEPADAPQDAPEPPPPAAEAPVAEAAAPAPEPYRTPLDTKVLMRDADWTPGEPETEFWLPIGGADLTFWFSEETKQCVAAKSMTKLQAMWKANAAAIALIREGDPTTYAALNKLKDQAKSAIGGKK